MKLKNMSKRIVFFVTVSVIGIVLSLGACDGSSPGARMLSGKGINSVYSHGEAFHGVTEVSTFPDPSGRLAIKFVVKGEPYWCFAAGCIRGQNSANVSDSSGSSTTRSAE
jgi:hypothetical protein